MLYNLDAAIALPGISCLQCVRVSSLTHGSSLQDMLKNHFGFTDDHMTILIDTGEHLSTALG
jgi:hypothetical protein